MITISKWLEIQTTNSPLSSIIITLLTSIQSPSASSMGTLWKPSIGVWPTLATSIVTQNSKSWLVQLTYSAVNPLQRRNFWWRNSVGWNGLLTARNSSLYWSILESGKIRPLTIWRQIISGAALLGVSRCYWLTRYKIQQICLIMIWGEKRQLLGSRTS